MTQPTEMQWVEEPPAAKQAGAKGSGKRQDLRDNPGKWALYGTYGRIYSATSSAAQLRKYGFEAVSRGLEVYARWNG